MKRLGISVAVAAVIAAAPGVASAFCGFYVGGAGQTLYNNATQVVLMRQGTKTVLSMQNAYKGPPKDFAMVVPVPVVLEEEHVKTLPNDIFTKVDKLAAPRLVEYWEMDPCAPEMRLEMARMAGSARGAVKRKSSRSKKDLGVTVEAKFTVGEYDIVILSAKESTGLDTWLRQEGYKIPEGAEPYLRPYVESGSKFFVAKVNTKKVKFKGGQAMLSPLRFHYDSKEFALPVRLGLMNSEGTQDLIVHILARGQRYEVANFKNVTIPTNLDLADAAKERFGEFYAALFDRTLESNKGAVVTEYAWDASTCDPCPTPALAWNDLATLGMDVIDGQVQGAKKAKPSGGARIRRPMPSGGFVLTRLHARYQKDNLGEDLIFKAAPPIAGGREFLKDGNKLEEGSAPSSVNNFQARYAIRHPWEGKIECDEPIRGRWGGPPSGAQPGPAPATELAFVPRGKIALASMVKGEIPGLELEPAPEESGADEVPSNSAGAAEAPAAGQPGADDAKKESSKGCEAGGEAPLWGALLIVLGLAWRRRYS